jgi:hypothetical protein
MRNDTLYFKYQIENKSDSIVVLYSIEPFAVKDGGKYMNSKDFYERAWPRLLTSIIGPNNEYPTMVLPISHIDRFPPDISLPPQSPTLPEYFILQPHQSGMLDNFLIFSSKKLLDDPLFKPEVNVLHCFLPDGVHKFQLEYFSNPAFRWKFRQDKHRDSRLQHSVMFEGVIKSNVCYFAYPDNFGQNFAIYTMVANLARYEFQQKQQLEAKPQAVAGGHKTYIRILISLFFILSLSLILKFIKNKYIRNG